MSKTILQNLFPTATIKRKFFKEYTYDLTLDGTIYHILKINIHKNTILSINSKNIWEVKYGKADGPNFKTNSKELINLKKFNALENKIIVFKEKPYKILKYLNESDIIDISNEKVIFDNLIFNQFIDINL